MGNVFYLGPAGTNSHEAARRRFGDNGDLCPCSSLEELFTELMAHTSAEGVVPVVNTTAGPVEQAIGEMSKHPELEIVDRFSVPVRHHLLAAVDAAADKIERIASHPQALEQCRESLACLYPNASLEEASSTAAACILALRDPHCAAVAGEAAGKLYGMSVLAKDVQDKAGNETRFYVVKRRDHSMNGLAQLRSIIASLDETLVHAFCRRAQFRRNATLYRERNSPGPLAELAERFAASSTIAARVHTLRPLYVNSILPGLCEEGEDGDVRKCIATDSSCLTALVQRLNLAEHVASLKMEEMPDALRVPLEKRDPVALEEAITNQAVEAEVVRRIIATSRETIPSDAMAERIAKLYEERVIPLSRKIQVRNLLLKS